MGAHRRRYVRTCERCESEFKCAKPQARFCSDNCRRRACADLHRGSCIDCGLPLAEGSVWQGTARCRLCHQKCFDELAAPVVQMWNEGKTIREIAQHFGWTENYAGVRLTRLRGHGYDLPYRRSSQALTAVRDGMARAAKKAA